MPALGSSGKMSGLTTAQQQSLERVWAQLVCLMQRDHVSELAMPMNIKNLLGKDGISILASRFGKFITAKVAMTEDTDNMTIQIKPQFKPWGFNVVADPEETETSRPQKVPRPPNAFILYRQYWHPFIKAAHPELHNIQISISLGKQWNNEDEAVKAEWRRKAEEFKKQHAITYPRYQYQPRKPSEKKRRVTRRKYGSSSSSAAVVPEHETNNAGSLVLTLDDDDLDDATFEAMHDNYNMSLPANTSAVSTLGSVIYTGHDEDSQGGWNIYQSQMDRIFKNSPTDADVEAEFTQVFQGVNTLDEAWAMLDPQAKAIHWDMFYKEASPEGSGRLILNE